VPRPLVTGTTSVFGYRIEKPIALGHVYINDANGKIVDVDIAGVSFTACL